MLELSDVLIGVAALAALGLVLLAHDWRDEYCERRAHRAGAAMHEAAPSHLLRDWWLKHRH